jgi:hypothetical protein
MLSFALMGQDLDFDQGFIADSMLHHVRFKSVRSCTLITPMGPMDLDIGRKAKEEREGGFMRKVLRSPFAFMVVALIPNFNAWAHTFFMTIEDNEDGSVTVSGMFSTGAVGSWVEVRLEDEKGKVLWEGKADDNGGCTFKKPGVP